MAAHHGPALRRAWARIWSLNNNAFPQDISNTRAKTLSTLQWKYFFPLKRSPQTQQQVHWGWGWERLRPASRVPLTLVMTRSVAVNCEPLLKVENSLRFHGHPREVKFCCYQAMAVKWYFPGSCPAIQKAARRPPTGAIPALPLGQQGWEDVSPSSPASLSAPPKARVGPQRTRRPLPWFFPRLCPGAACKGS